MSNKRRTPKMYVARLIIYMPIYGEPGLKKVIKKELLSTLKGKACFHINKLDKALIAQIREALEVGHKFYKKNGWV